MKISAALLVLFQCFLSGAALGQVFKGHRLGETAQQFFSIAKSEHNMLTTIYCKGYLANPKVLKAYERAKAHPDDAHAVLVSADVNGCRDVQAALDGKDVRVGARFATELNNGWAEFYKSRLVILTFTLNAGISFEDVVSDIDKELGGVEPARTTVTRQSRIGSILQERRANWIANNLEIQAEEMKDVDDDLGISVTVVDSEYLKEKEANRPSTIR